MATTIVETARKLEKASLTAILWEDGKTENAVSARFEGATKLVKADGGNPPYKVEVQFNPASLKLNCSNQVKTNDQGNGSSMQFAGRGASKLSLELIFDVSGLGAIGISDVHQMSEKIAALGINDVRQMSGKISAFLKTTQTEMPSRKGVATVPGVRFQWGTFLFDGVLESIDETLDFWSEDGRPLRSTISLSLTQPGLHNLSRDNPNATAALIKGLTSSPGTQKNNEAPANKSLQSIVADANAKADWKAIAAQNGIENPRHIAAGTLLNLQGAAKSSGNLAAKADGFPGAPLSALEFEPFETAKVSARVNARASLTGSS
jgi:hypothetical protein